MCGAVVPLVSAGIGTINAISQANYQAAVAQRQAQLDAAAAHNAAIQTELDTTRQFQTLGSEQGQTRAMAAAGGVATGYGTSADAVASSQVAADPGLNQQFQRGWMGMTQADTAGALAEGAASQANWRSDLALWQGISGAAQTADSTLLGNARQFGSLGANFA